MNCVTEFETEIEIPVKVRVDFNHLGYPGTRDGMEPPDMNKIEVFAGNPKEDIWPFDIMPFLPDGVMEELIDQGADLCRRGE